MSPGIGLRESMRNSALMVVARNRKLSCACSHDPIPTTPYALEPTRAAARPFRQAVLDGRPSHRLAEQLLNGGVDGYGLHWLGTILQHVFDRREHPSRPVSSPSAKGRQRPSTSRKATVTQVLSGFGASRSSYRLKQVIDERLDP